jgi:hypothetical protein
MKKGINLNKRVIGPWANFEATLRKDEHAGFIDWRGANAFRLKKTPFSNHYSDFLYVVPKDVKKIPEQGLIRVKTGELYSNIRLQPDSTYGSYTNQAYIVEGYELLNIDSLPKPRLSKDELLFQVAEEWAGSDEYPLFRKEMVYNLLSCPKDFFGTGGIGVETFAPIGNKQTMKFLKSSINHLLPEDFTKHNDIFEYNFIEKEGDLKITNERRNNPHSNEISFNDMSKLPTNLSIQIPLILPDDFPHKSMSYQNPDILDYQLSALLIKPVIEPNLIEEFTNLAKQTSDYIDKNYTEETLLLDRLSLIKIACASCRLDMKCKLDEDMLPGIKDELFHMFKEYADTHKDKMIAGGVARWNIPMTPLPLRRNLTVDANKLYKEILAVDKLNEEIGVTWVPTETLKQSPNLKYINDFTLLNSLTELNNANFILQRKNYSEILVVDYSK